ncbi:MAG: thiamine phosphate synthase [Rhodospirillaceae bacterium]
MAGQTPSCRLYLVTPPALPDVAGFARTLEEVLAAGDVACVQLRLKDVGDEVIQKAVKTLMPVCHAKDVAFILNDRPDLAAAFNCDGVHIGPEDAPYEEARRLVGADKTVGVTCKDSRHDAMEAAEAGADYVAFGAFFPTATKQNTASVTPEILEIWTETTTVPCVAIGGITVENCAPLVQAGADFIAVCNGVWSYPQGPAAAVRDFNAILARYPART